MLNQVYSYSALSNSRLSFDGPSPELCPHRNVRSITPCQTWELEDGEISSSRLLHVIRNPIGRQREVGNYPCAAASQASPRSDGYRGGDRSPRLGGRFSWPHDQFWHFEGLAVTPYHYQPRITARIVMWAVHQPTPSPSSAPSRLLSAKTSVPYSPWIGRDSPQLRISESVLSTVEGRKALGDHHRHMDALSPNPELSKCASRVKYNPTTHHQTGTSSLSRRYA